MDSTRTVHTYGADGSTPAPPDAVFSLLTDVTTWANWGPFDEAGVDTAGDELGVGEIRAFRVGRARTREEVTEVQPGRRLAYRLVSGLPIRHQGAAVELVPDGTGTRIHWHGRFAPRIPFTGGMISRRLDAFIAELVDGLARASASHTTGA